MAAEADATPLEPPQPAFSTVKPVKGSMLFKQGNKSSSCSQHIFLLEGEFLYYYETTRDAAPRGVVWLRGAKVSPAPHVNGPEKGLHGFTVKAIQGWKPHSKRTFEYRTYVLFAKSYQDLNEWIALLRKAAEGWQGSADA